MTPMTSTTVTPSRPLPGWLKTGLLAALVFALCWGGAIAWWQTAGSEPGASDLALMLLALPCGLLLVGKLGKKLVVSRAAVPAATAARPAPGQAASAASAPPLAILAAALRSPHGASVDELAAAIAENAARPDLDPELVDDDGFPVTSARNMDAVDEAVQEEVTEWLELNGMAELRFSDAQWRALILGTAVARDLAAHAVSELMPPEGNAPTMQLVPVLPAGWTDEQRRAMGMWFKHTLAQFGWPAAGILPAELPATSGKTPTPALLGQFFGQFALDSRAGDGRLAALVIACDSHIDQETVDQWAANGSLFTPARPQGLVPGEGAAGLLLSSLHGARLIEGAVFGQLHPMVEARRDASLDDVKRADTKLIAELSESVARAAGVELSKVAAMAADTDHRAKRGLELMGLASSALPQLDGTLDVARVGVPFGACGAVPFVAALALAQHHALAANAAALFISNDDPLSCCAALVCPPAA
ncbi:MAG: hypothetical protein ABWY02_08080 [Telluria sp.]